ncbi:MAG: aldo/keto reductase [Candidatus Korobacteraceae bacterium]|jgi:aryl-alcohol dehydrogenase-like predicted oxidoreductase
MERRKLGNSGLEIGLLTLGTNVFGWTADEATSFRILDAFIDAGFNLVDTADTYTTFVPGNKGGESETIIGKWLKKSGKRDKVLIATKGGNKMGPGKEGLSAAYLTEALEASLRRLQTDYIDLYQTHRNDLNTPLQETLGALGKFVKAGKVRAIGASNLPAGRLAESFEVSSRLGLPRFESLQPEYHLANRADYEAALEPLCLKEGIGVINFYSLAAGFLTGKYRSEGDLSKSPRGQRTVKRFLNERGFRILHALDVVSKELNATPAQVAIAWLIARPSITAPIASATSVEQLQDLLKATTLKLDRSSIELLNQASE